MTIAGSHLCDVFGGGSLKIDLAGNGGVSASNIGCGSDSNTVTFQYAVGNGAASGLYNVAITTAFGEATGSLSVVRPTPVIASVTSSTWTPGSGTFPVTIKGQFYGPYVNVSVQVPGLAAPPTITNVVGGASGEIDLSVTMAASSPGGTGTLTAISYNDAENDGPLSSAPFSITVPGEAGPAPVINSIAPTQLTEAANSFTLNGTQYTGTTGTLTISGSNLGNIDTAWFNYDGCYNSTTPANSTCAMVFTGGSASASSVTVNYALLSTAPPGAYTLTLETSYSQQASITVTVVTPTPVITSVTPVPWNVVNCSTPFKIQGTFLGPALAVAAYPDTVDLSSMTFTTVTSTEIDGTLNFNPNAPGGQTQIYMVSLSSATEDAGDGLRSAPYNVTVTPIPIPAISGITGGAWDAGSQNLPFTINGTNFGSNPTVTITGSGVLSYPITSTSNTAISGEISIDWAAPAGDATVQVQAAGCSESSSSSVASSSSAKRSDVTAMQAAADGPVGGDFVQPIDPFAPTPQIVWGSDTAACNTPGANVPPASVVIGQQMTLAGCIPGMPSGTDLGVISQSWNIGGDITAGYSYPPGDTSFQQGAMEIPFSGASNNPVLFYWKAIPLGQGPAIQPTGGTNAGYNATYTYTLNNLSTSSVSVPFTVNGPTPTGPVNDASPNGAFFTAIPGTVNVWPANLAFGGGKYPGLEFGNDGKTSIGMTFRATATAPQARPGTFQWVQLITSSTVQTLSSPATPNGTLGTGLDNWYPYVANDPLAGTNDSPGMPLVAFADANHTQLIPMGEGADIFGATMYLMWDPSLNADGSACLAASTTQDPQTGKVNPPVPSGCTGSIPVPLGYVNWGFSADAINTLQPTPPVGQGCPASACGDNGTTWKVECGSGTPAAPPAQSSDTYPWWTTTARNTL